MKYEADIDPANANTSHNIMLQLVGDDKRVLDVGCATGYLARALVAKGCTVSGVELDPQAAEEARPILKELVVANLEELDLADAFGKNVFDVVVFGDVLEHLKDPLKVLRASLPLLDEGGFVVMSIPNVAHVSVRLALLKGKFEYSDLGLLDDTHLRFFTRASLDEMLRAAELVAVESRRTTAGFFDTEIPLDPSDYAPELLAALSNDPDGRTYQFVVKAVPVDSSPALRRLHQQTTEQGAEIRRLRRALAGVLADDNPVASLQVGLWSHFGLDDLGTALLGRVVARELTQRLPGVTIRRFAPVVIPLRIDAGQPVEALGPWSRARAETLADELDAVVVTGPLGVPPSAYQEAEALDALLELDSVMYHGLGPALEERCPVLYAGVERSPASPVTRQEIAAALVEHRYAATTDGLSADSPGVAGAGRQMPDPLLLVGRVFDVDQLRHRGAFLRMMGWYPQVAPAVVLHGDADIVAFAPALARVIDEVATAMQAHTTVIEANVVTNDALFVGAIGPAMRQAEGVVPVDAGVVDLLAALACAEVVITTSPGLFALAFAFGRRCVGLDLLGTGRFDEFARSAGVVDCVVGKPSQLPAALDHWPAEHVRAGVLVDLQHRVDEHFDRVSALVTVSGRTRRASDDAPLDALSPATRLAALEAAHDALLSRMAAERLAFADRAIAFGGTSRVEVERLRAELAAARANIDAIYATRTMRVLQPAREIYGRRRKPTP